MTLKRTKQIIVLVQPNPYFENACKHVSLIESIQNQSYVSTWCEKGGPRCRLQNSKGYVFQQKRHKATTEDPLS